MKAAVSEFSLAALSTVAALVFAATGDAQVGVPVSLGSAVFFGLLGHRHRVRKLAAREHLAQIASTERIVIASRSSLELQTVAEEIKASGLAQPHWIVQRGEVRRSSTPPPGVDPFDYLLYRHTRSASEPPKEPTLPRIRNFLDLREAALLAADRAFMADLLVKHIHRVFPGHDAYTGVLVPRTGNVALGVAVAEQLGVPPVLVRDRPLFGKSTESVLTAGLLILVDDIWSDGAELRRAVELARFDNFSIADGVLLIARAEGDVEADLARSNVTLRPYIRIDDEALDDVLRRVSGHLNPQLSTLDLASIDATRDRLEERDVPHPAALPPVASIASRLDEPNA